MQFSLFISLSRLLREVWFFFPEDSQRLREIKSHFGKGFSFFGGRRKVDRGHDMV